MTTKNQTHTKYRFTPSTTGKPNGYSVEQKKIKPRRCSQRGNLMNKKTADRQVSDIIPNGKGYNIARRLPTAKQFGVESIYLKQLDESTSKKFAMIRCNCCTRMVSGVIVTLGGIRDEIPLHMPCVSCGKWLGHLEEDNEDALAKMCLDCFKEETA